MWLSLVRILPLMFLVTATSASLNEVASISGTFKRQLSDANPSECNYATHVTVTFNFTDIMNIYQEKNIQEANYTMFSSTGRPIRAEVLLRIQHEMSPDVLKHWYDNFRTAFKGDQSKLVKQEQNYSALLNLNL